ncbi:hypothetical protein [Reinekea sp. G2M2-21]|uniref:hypothetical protein n=1 Tax=Reinekea sp. G2M2-21 TaxID=2788942 RepID=UPI0018AC519F|nr:hypothetical protein [Reinekea sp. G2M2-21]
MKCNECDLKLKRRFEFWIKPSDAIGGVLVFAMLVALFFGVLSLVIETARVGLIPAFRAVEHGVSNWLDLFGEALDTIITVSIIVYFFMKGGAKFTKYYSYFFDLKFQTFLECNVCKKRSAKIELPEVPKS